MLHQCLEPTETAHIAISFELIALKYIEQNSGWEMTCARGYTVISEDGRELPKPLIAFGTTVKSREYFWLAFSSFY